MLTKKVMILAIFLVSLLAVSAVGAADNATGDFADNQLSAVEDNSTDINSKENTLNLENEEILSGDDDYVDASDAYRYLNEFRSEEGVWFWAPNDMDIVYFNTNDDNQLKPLERDPALEEAAKIRAKEISEVFEHVRPDGTDCFTAYPDGYWGLGENLVVAYTAKDATESWKEEFLPFELQGHRRSMLSSSFNRVGIAGYRDSNGAVYWVQAFGIADSEIEVNPKNLTKDGATFADLNNLIKNNLNINLECDYTFYNDSSEGILIDKSITIDGENHIIDARKSSRIFNITADNVVLKNIIFKNAYIDYDYGGCIYTTAKNLIISNCTFKSNFAYYGSAIASTNGDITLSDCNFDENWGVEGSAIYSTNSKVTLNNCKFCDNTALLYGTIKSISAEIILNNCKFIKNGAYSGAAVHIFNSKASISKSSFINNDAIVYGGGLYLAGSDVTLTDSIFNNNYVDSEYYYNGGGAIYTNTGNLTVVNSDFNNNHANITGGALFLECGNLNLTGCRFTGNFLNSTYFVTFGGAIYSVEGIISVKDSTFNNNSAYDGGVLYSADGNADFTGCNLTDNIAETGGAFFIIDTNLTIEKSDCIKNSAIYGGVVHSNNADIYFIKSNMENNFALCGGVTFSANTNIKARDSQFTKNSVKEEYNANGGAIFLSAGNLDIFNCIFKENLAESEYYISKGAAIFISGAKLIASECSFIANDAYDGSSIHSMNSNIEVSSCSFINNTGAEGPGIYSTDGNASVTGCSFKNSDALYGGALYSINSNLTAENSDFTNNTAEYGGAIYSYGGNVLAKGCNFTANSAEYGGATYGWNASQSTFTENRAEYSAGAMYGIPNFASECRFIKNIASLEGPTFNVETKECVFEANRLIKKAHIDTLNIASSYNQGDLFYVYLYTDYYEYISDAVITLRAYKNSNFIKEFDFVCGEGWIINITEGNYIFKLSVENQDYIVEDAEVAVEILKKEFAVLDIEVSNRTYLEPVTADLTSNVDGNVEIYLDGFYFNYLPVSANKALQMTFSNLAAGNHFVEVTITPSNSAIDAKTFKKDFTVYKKETSINIDVKNATAGENVIVYVTASQNGNVNVKAGNIVKNVNVNANVKTEVDLGALNADLYDVKATFKADDNFKESTASKTLKVFDKITEDDIHISIPEDSPEDIVINLPADATGKVTLNIAGKNYDVNVINGVADVKLPDLTGDNPYTITYSGDDKYSGFGISGTLNRDSSGDVKLTPEVEIISLNDESGEIRLPSDATGTVTLTINNRDYTFNVVNGIANVIVPDLSNGNYPYVIKYSGDDKYSSVVNEGSLKINRIIETVIDAADVTTVYNGGKYLIITLKDINGNPIDGVKVTVILNGKTYTPPTENGQVKVSTNALAPNTYPAKIIFDGNAKYAKSEAQVNVIVKKAAVKVTAKAKSFKKSDKTKKYTVTLKTNKNAPMNKVKLTLKVSGKTYSATTNAKGQATFKLTKLTKKGKFTATLKYGGNKYYNAKTVKPKITVK